MAAMTIINGKIATIWSIFLIIIWIYIDYYTNTIFVIISDQTLVSVGGIIS